MAARDESSASVSTSRSAAAVNVAAEVTFQIRTCTPGDDEALSLLGQATFVEAYAGSLNGPDILAHCARAHSASVYRAWVADER
jgi:hypothetical protein